MGRPPRETQKLGEDELGRMARVSTKNAIAPRSDGRPTDADGDIAVSAGADLPTSSRTTTLSDPLTMALLAEVARSSKTVDFDPAKLDEAQRLADGAALAADDDDADVEITLAVHPHVKRR